MDIVFKIIDCFIYANGAIFIGLWVTALYYEKIKK